MDIKIAANNIISHLSLVLNQLNDADYSKPLQLYSGTTIGQHIRHTIEFFQCLIEQCNTGVIDYDARQHNLDIETNINTALKAVKAIDVELNKLDLSANLNLEVSYDVNSNSKTVIASNVERELVYTIEHAIHHLALVKIGLIFLKPDIELPVDFGVAPSTLKYKEQCAQ